MTTALIQLDTGTHKHRTCRGFSALTGSAVCQVVVTASCGCPIADTNAKALHAHLVSALQRQGAHRTSTPCGDTFGPGAAGCWASSTKSSPVSSSLLSRQVRQISSLLAPEEASRVPGASLLPASLLQQLLRVLHLLGRSSGRQRVQESSWRTAPLAQRSFCSCRRLRDPASQARLDSAPSVVTMPPASRTARIRGSEAVTELPGTAPLPSGISHPLVPPRFRRSSRRRRRDGCAPLG
jgi:hypothetical protein